MFNQQKENYDMNVTLAEIAKLRATTQAGMMDCKNALIEANGDFERAVEIIREKGKMIASKRSDRTASEGVVVAKVVDGKAYMVCLACETDFVSQTEGFGATVNEIMDVAIAADAADVEALLAAKNAEGRTIADLVTEKSGQTSEKCEIAYYARIEAPYCAQYVHFNKKLGSIIGFNKEVPAELAHEVCMQATAMGPIAISPADCPADVIEKERKIGMEAARLEGKPEAMLERIAEGKVQKFLKENTLLEQPSNSNPKESVGAHIKSVDAEATVVAYKRFSLND